MRVFAYCAESFVKVARRAAGIRYPLTCPPVDATTIDLAALEGHDLLYFDLHGQPGDPRWYGDAGWVALTAEQLRQVDLSETIIFATNCYLGDEDSPMLSALLDSKARFVIGAPGENYSGVVSQIGAALLARAFRLLLSGGADPLQALAVAKSAVKMQRLRGVFQETAARLLGAGARERAARGLIEAANDTLEFKAFYREV